MKYPERKECLICGKKLVEINYCGFHYAQFPDQEFFYFKLDEKDDDTKFTYNYIYIRNNYLFETTTFAILKTLIEKTHISFKLKLFNSRKELYKFLDNCLMLQ